jgi:aspartyl-tRNA(Asn)/glutamyl-tRNA(Gln) amidotransferase subunit B
MDRLPKSDKLLKGATGNWEVVIGMEVHAQVTSNAKLFSGAAAAFGGEPNARVSLVDAAMPGMLPVINDECVRQAIRTGLGLKAKINLKSVFDRKNYFYPDLPQGYQITQYKSPMRPLKSGSIACTSSRTPASRYTTNIPAYPWLILIAAAWP